MERPQRKDYYKPFDSNFVRFDRRNYIKALEKYIDYLEKKQK